MNRRMLDEVLERLGCPPDANRDYYTKYERDCLSDARDSFEHYLEAGKWSDLVKRRDAPLLHTRLLLLLGQRMMKTGLDFGVKDRLTEEVLGHQEGTVALTNIGQGLLEDGLEAGRVGAILSLVFWSVQLGRLVCVE